MVPQGEHQRVALKYFSLKHSFPRKSSFECLSQVYLNLVNDSTRGYSMRKNSAKGVE